MLFSGGIFIEEFPQNNATLGLFVSVVMATLKNPLIQEHKSVFGILPKKRTLNALPFWKR